MRKLLLILGQLEFHIPNYEKTNLAVSQSTIGWQIDHSLIVINAVVQELKNSSPKNYRWKFNKMRLLIKIVNKIPRGKVRVPKSVKPIDTAKMEELKNKLEFARKNIADISTLPPNSYFTHPFFGDLNLKATIWFLKLHTKHHLKIIEDIVKTS
ncbi:DUF1569 domain-containing protein [Flavobacterium paronense]|uniref:DinB family protein n=1 Tax=Flavobacterium paronense TaxID=1392775 RepID=A0ABV5GBY0_9FLAO|nr:DUF1569 domain-containing protein [Flavobacterium paronense]MDN3677736.1 DUF1569 domain-containing protein [Flavobacterium paronense]